MLFFVFALLILILSTLPWVAVTRPSNKTAMVLGLYLLCSANVVFTGYIANSFRLLNQRWFILVIHILIGGIGFLIWKRYGKPSLIGPFQGWKYQLNVQVMKNEPILTMLTAFIALAYLFTLAQVILIPQNNMDSLSTHLSRIGFWRQNGSFFPWPTTMLNQVWYPVNAQLQTLWTLLFLGSDHLVGAIQWLAALVSALGVYGLARSFGYHRRGAAFAGLIFLSFPLIALQSTTTQTDLVTMVFFILAIYFLIGGLQDQRLSLLILSAISIGIGVGVKKSYLILLPAIAVIALFALWQFGRHSFKPLIYWVFSTSIAIVLLGMYGYAVNWYYFGDPFGSPSYLASMVENPPMQDAASSETIDPNQNGLTDSPPPSSPPTDSPPQGGIFTEIVFNAPRLIFQSLDTSGLPNPLDGYAHKVKMRLARSLSKVIGFEEIEGTAYTAPGHVFSFSDKNINEESHAWYGPLSFLLLLPALTLETLRGIRQKQPLLAGPGIALLIFLPLEIVLRPGWDPFQGRYFTPLVALCSPMIAFWFKETGSAWYEWLISGTAVLFVTVTLLYNPSKPTLGKYADELQVWGNDRITIQTIQRKSERELYSKVDEIIPANATLAYYIPFFFLDYPLFGRDQSRRLIPIVSPSQVSDIEWLRKQDVEYLLLPRKDGYPLPPAEFFMIAALRDWKLYKYASE